MIAACGMGIQLREDRHTGGADKDRQCDWRQEVGPLVDALDEDGSGVFQLDDLLDLNDSERPWEESDVWWFYLGWTYHQEELEKITDGLAGALNEASEANIEGITGEYLLGYWER